MNMKEYRIWINARFLGRNITGVERVARQIIGQMAGNLLDAEGCWQEGSARYRFVLVAPGSMQGESPWPNLALEKHGRLCGHLWEQLELPAITGGDLLLSLCNTGPLFKRQQVVFLHDAQPFAIPENFSIRFRLWYQVMFRCLSRTANRVLVNSNFTRKELHRHIGLEENRTDLCYLGSEHVKSPVAGSDPLSRFNLPGKPFVLAVSSANRNKNFPAVVKALEMLGDAAPPCVIVGKMNQVHFGGNTLDTDKVTHLSYVSDEELYALYQRALCLVFPSFYEGFGLPPLEAMALGCPVVVSRTSSLPEIGGDAVHYCNPHDPATLASAIRALAISPEQREICISKGLARADRFSWQRSAEVVLKVIASACESESGRHARRPVNA
jgi:glycosyltransferase involved in cell wall biosynthesis